LSPPQIIQASRPAPAGAGVTEAAVLHLRSLVVRLRLANREFREAERKLDEIRAALSKEAPSVKDTKPRGAAIPASLPGVAGARWPPCSPKRPGRSAAGTAPRSGPCPAWRR
jgi:hypothetical protein